MQFSVVNTGYDRDQVDSCLKELGERLARVAAQAEAVAGTNADVGAVRAEIARMRGFLGASPQRSRTSEPGRKPAIVTRAEAEAAEILAQARDELTAAREEARLVRDQVYAEALQARRDFEAALYARRLREQQVDEILRGVAFVPVPADPAADPTTAVPATVTPAGTVTTTGGAPAATGVPATRAAAGGAAELSSPPTDEPAQPAPIDQGSTAPAR